MLTARVLLTDGSSGIAPARAEIVREALRAHSLPTDGIEHITATATASGIDVVFFLREDAPESPLSLLRVIASATETSPALRGLRVILPG